MAFFVYIYLLLGFLVLLNIISSNPIISVSTFFILFLYNKRSLLLLELWLLIHFRPVWVYIILRFCYILFYLLYPEFVYINDEDFFRSVTNGVWSNSPEGGGSPPPNPGGGSPLGHVPSHNSPEDSNPSHNSPENSNPNTNTNTNTNSNTNTNTNTNTNYVYTNDNPNYSPETRAYEMQRQMLVHKLKTLAYDGINRNKSMNSNTLVGVRFTGVDRLYMEFHLQTFHPEALRTNLFVHIKNKGFTCPRVSQEVLGYFTNKW